jgi:uncharacterized membrane protein
LQVFAFSDRKADACAGPVEYNEPASAKGAIANLMPTASKLSSKARILWALLFGAVAASTVAAPLLTYSAHPLPAAGIYLFFSPLCHQMPTRSYQLCGQSLALCHRCFGIALGLFAAALLPPAWCARLCEGRRRRLWALTAALLLAFDATLPYFGIWTNTPVSRFVAGALFGVMLASFALPGLLELMLQYVPTRIPRRS